MAFLPSGDILVAEKGSGQAEDSWSSIKLVHNGIFQEEPVLTLSTNSFWDSGLLAIIFDPDFTNNNWLYVWYATGKASAGWTGETALRLSRFVYDSSKGKIDLSGETVVLEDKPWFKYHHGNALMFDHQGNLLLAMGNRGELPSSQDMSVLYGKIIRIHPNETGYDIPEDNPYINDPNVRPEIYSIGLRNPYRMADRAEDGLILVGDVGANSWEEIDLLSAGANYGYPEREGPCPLHQMKPCAATPPQFTDPIITYPHDESLGIGTSGAVTGITFYEGNAFPTQYWNKLLFTDFNQGFVASADPSNGTFEIFAEGVERLVDIEYFREGLYWLELYSGAIVLVSYTGQDNQVPSAVLTAAPQAGAPPLEVTFSGEGSVDPDGIVLKYHWDFGDGTSAMVTDGSMVNHTYSIDGTYQASLQVVDIRGGESAVVNKTITVYSGEFPTIGLENLTDPGRELYHGGDEWRYEAKRSNVDGLDSEKPFSWRIDLQHNQHAHPIIVDTAVISDVLTITTDNHGGDWNIWYKLYLTMNIDTGKEVTISQEIFPALVDLTIDTRPRSTTIAVNQAQYVSPRTYRSIVGTEQVVMAPPTMIFENDIWLFNRWQAQGTTVFLEPQITFPTPENRTTYIAGYIYDRPAETSWLPVLGN